MAVTEYHKAITLLFLPSVVSLALWTEPG